MKKSKLETIIKEVLETKIDTLDISNLTKLIAERILNLAVLINKEDYKQIQKESLYYALKH